MKTWQEEFGVEIKKINKEYGEIATNMPFPLWGLKQVCGPLIKRCYMVSFGFLNRDMISETSLPGIFEKIEKRYLLNLLKNITPASEFIIAEGGVCPNFSAEYLEDLPEIRSIELKEEIADKKIMFFSRMPWKHERQEDWQTGEDLTRARARFNFLILDKVAQC